MMEGKAPILLYSSLLRVQRHPGTLRGASAFLVGVLQPSKKPSSMRMAGTAKFFESIGFAGWMAYPVIAFEVLGGLMLILGIVPRWVAAVAVVQLFVASTVHFGNGWGFASPNGGWEYPIFLVFAAAALALLGDGAYALKRSTRA